MGRENLIRTLHLHRTGKPKRVGGWKPNWRLGKYRVQAKDPYKMLQEVVDMVVTVRLSGDK